MKSECGLQGEAVETDNLSELRKGCLGSFWKLFHEMRRVFLGILAAPWQRQCTEGVPTEWEMIPSIVPKFPVYSLMSWPSCTHDGLPTSLPYSSPPKWNAPFSHPSPSPSHHPASRSFSQSSRSKTDRVVCFFPVSTYKNATSIRVRTLSFCSAGSRAWHRAGANRCTCRMKRNEYKEPSWT